MSSVKSRDRELRNQPVVENVDPPTGAPDPAVPSEARETDRNGILVNHSIHRGTYPIVGLKVAQARTVLSPFMNVNPESVAVIAGEIV